MLLYGECLGPCHVTWHKAAQSIFTKLTEQVNFLYLASVHSRYQKQTPCTSKGGLALLGCSHVSKGSLVHAYTPGPPHTPAMCQSHCSDY